MRANTAKTFLGLTLVAIALSTAPAAAQSPTASTPAPAPAPAKPADTASIWTLQGENASISTAKLTDRDYTNGIRLGWTSGEGGVPDFLQGIGQTLWGDGR